MDAEPWSSSHRFLTRIEETVAEYRSRDIHLHTHPIVLRSCEAGRLCRWTQFLSIGTPRMPYNALEWHVSVQMNVTKAGFAVSYIVSHTCWQPVPQRLISANVDNVTAAGIYALRRLKLKRCGELASRLSSRLTFAYVYVVVRAIHLGSPMQSEAIVDVVPCLDVVIFGTSRHGKGNTDICGGVYLPG